MTDRKQQRSMSGGRAPDRKPLAPAWADVDRERAKDPRATPIVTVFGAGVSGLSVAHELVERGFAVQVVEAAADPDQEYACRVGGMAGNQLVRTVASSARLHPYLYAEEEDSEDNFADLQGAVIILLKGGPGETVTMNVDGTDYQVALAGDPSADSDTIYDALVQIPGIAAEKKNPVVARYADPADPRFAPQIRFTSSALVESQTTPFLAARRGILIWLKPSGVEETVTMRVDGSEYDVPLVGNPTYDRDQIYGVLGKIPGLAPQKIGEDAVLARYADPANDPQFTPRIQFSESAIVHYEQTYFVARLRANPMQELEPRYAVPDRLHFTRGITSTTWQVLVDDRGVPNSLKLQLVLSALQDAYADYLRRTADRVQETTSELNDLELSARMQLREELAVEIRAYTDETGTFQANLSFARTWAGWVRDELESLNQASPLANQIPDLRNRLILVPLGDLAPASNRRLKRSRDLSNRVEFRIVESVVPAEHGYRFFPRFYRHLSDTMKRTPILEDDRETGQTAFDQLIPTETIDLAFDPPRDPPCRPAGSPAVHPDEDKEYPESIRVRLPRTLEELRKLVRIHLEKDRVNVTERDLIRFQFRLMQFLTTSRVRRREQLEGVTWLKYLGGDRPDYYTDAMLRVLQDTPQALVAMNAVETDARTMGTVYTQLLLDSLTDGRDSNRTLDGPTSEVWLEHWKCYLKRQGVRFFVGNLVEVQWANGVLLPVVGISSRARDRVTAAVLGEGAESYEIFIDGITTTVDGGRVAGHPGWSRLERRQAIAGAMKDAINESADGAANATLRENGTSFDLTPRYAPGARLLRIVRSKETSVRVNGRSFRLQGAEPRSVRNQLFDRLTADSTLTAGAQIKQQGGRSISIEPSGAMISVISDEAGRYAVRIGDRSFVVQRHGDEAVSLRDDLLNRISPPAVEGGPDAEEYADSPVQAGKFGETGIWITGTSDVEILEGLQGLALGPDVYAETIGAVEVVYGGVVSVRTRFPSIILLGADSEEPGQTLIEFPETGDAIAPGGGPDFYVVALPYEAASDIAWQAMYGPDAGELGGVLEQQIAFDILTGYRDEHGDKIALDRDGNGRPPKAYPLRDLSGIQYYFANEVRIGRGHTYYMKAPWGLSSISQLAYWRERMSSRSAFLGQLSVDIGNWYRPVEGELSMSPSAWRSSKSEIANGVWQQVKEGLDPEAVPFIIDPTYYHLDSGIDFGDGNEPLQFGSIATVEWPSTATAFQLEIDGVTITRPTLDQLVQALADEPIPGTRRKLGHAAVQISDWEIAIAPKSRLTSEVRVGVRARSADVEYRMVVNGTPIDFPPPPPPAIQEVPDKVVRDYFVDEINARVPGVIAEADDGDGCHPKKLRCAVRIRSAASRDVEVSALALGSDFENRLLASPSGSTTLKALYGARITTDKSQVSPQTNRTPFVINGATGRDGKSAAWKKRPGLFDECLAERARHDFGSYTGEALSNYEIGYIESNVRWLMAGNQMATFTRVSSMESANESARHCVRAILHRLLADTPDLYNGQGRLLGDFPEIWKPEENEIDDFEALKRLDEKLYETKDSHGNPLPHLFDILHLDKWVANLPEIRDGVLSASEVEDLLKLLRDRVPTDWSFTQFDEVDNLLRAVMRVLANPPKFELPPK